MDDLELLLDYAKTGREKAFSELVARHVNLVFSAALRQLGGDRHLAEEVTQSVFCDLARKALALSGSKTLSGWLYTSTRFAAAKRIRTEQRRIAREQEAYQMQDNSTDPRPNEDWKFIEPVLDEAMHDLKESDRAAILLRFFEQRPFNAVGETLGVSSDGARMRVDRALEKLRSFLKKRGVSTSCATLALLLAEQGAAAAPAGLAGTIAAGAIAGAAATTAVTSTALTWIQFMSMTKAKAGAIALLMAAAAGPAALQYQTNNELRARNNQLHKENANVAAQLAPIVAENARLSRLVQSGSPANGAGLSNEIYQLRAEVTRLRQEARATAGPSDPIHATLQTLGVRVASLKQRLEQMPQTKIPELQYLTEKHWLEAVGAMQTLESDEDYRTALNMLRTTAKSEAGGRLQKAVHKYSEANGGTLPASLADVQPYLEQPIDPAVLERYQMVASGKLGEMRKDQALFEEIAAPVDDEYDSYVRFHKNGRSTTSFSQVGFAIEAATEAYANANGGKLPNDAAHLNAYLPQPIDPARVQKFLSKIPPDVTTLAQMKARKN